MACDICMHNPCLSGCPNYTPPFEPVHHCSICDENIYVGDQYVFNGYEYAHLDCIDTVKEAFEFAGVEIEKDEEYDYEREYEE